MTTYYEKEVNSRLNLAYLQNSVLSPTNDEFEYNFTHSA